MKRCPGFDEDGKEFLCDGTHKPAVGQRPTCVGRAVSAAKPVPTWAESWARGKCPCSARLVNVACYCGGHVVCAASGWDPQKCNGVEAVPSDVKKEH